MKKLTFIFAIACALTACSKYEVSDAVSADQLKKATISGVVYVDADQRNSGLEPAKGVTLLFQVNYNLLLAGAQGVYTVSTTTDDNGGYSVKFPAPDEGVTAKITGSQIVTDVNKYSGTEKHSFELSDQTEKVYPDLAYVKNLNYVQTSETFPAVWRNATLAVTIKYSNGLGQSVAVPANTAIRLTYTNSANKTAYVEANVAAAGKVTFTVPAREVIDGGTQVTLSSTALLPFGANSEPKSFTYSKTATVYGGETTTIEDSQFN
jgi:hypothetical protein